MLESDIAGFSLFPRRRANGDIRDAPQHHFGNNLLRLKMRRIGGNHQNFHNLV